MADALRPTINVVPEFSDGERPTAAKLNTLGLQLDRATDAIELAIGDIHGESWPYSGLTDTRLSPAWGRKYFSGAPVTGASERALDIANLARLIGPASNLNARQLTEQTTVTETLPSDGETSHDLQYLPYQINGAASYTLAGTGAEFTNEVASVSDIDAAGDYYITDNGVIHTYTPINGGTIEYTIWPRRWRGGMNNTWARFNVIPDPNQVTSSSSEKLAFGSIDPQGRYPITLPKVTHAQATPNSATDSQLTTIDPNYDQTYTLPKVLVDNFDVDERIPDGFLYLRNMTTNETYTDGQYYYNGPSAIKVGNVDLDSAIAALNDFVILTVGSDITTAIDDLREKSHHRHSRAYGEPFIRIQDVTGFTKEVPSSGVYVPSEIPGNFAPQYLHRDGVVGGVDNNANDANIMRGQLFLGRTGGAPGTYGTHSSDSFKLALGTNNASLYYADATSELTIENNASSLSAGHIRLITQPTSGGSDTAHIYLSAEPASEVRVTGGDFRVNSGVDAYFEGLTTHSEAIVMNGAGLRSEFGANVNGVKPYTRGFSVSTPNIGNSVLLLDLDSIGFSTSYKLVGLNAVMQRDGAATELWNTPSDGASFGQRGYYVYVAPSTGQFGELRFWNVDINPGSWPDLDVQVIVWFRTLL